MTDATLRQRLGCWLHERWRLELVLRTPALARMLGLSWLDTRNRAERLHPDRLTGGRICDWANSSTLTVVRTFPEIGSRLIQHCLQQWPVALEPPTSRTTAEVPEVSVIFGVRGTGRMEQFQACLKSLLSQRGVSFEIVVVEQSWQSAFSDRVPDGVRYLHQQCTDPGMPFNRSWALNGGARVARGRVLVLHDADMLLPRSALASIVAIIDKGVDAVRLPRLLFYLDAQSSSVVQSQGVVPENCGFERVIANNRTPIAVTRSAYFAIGGHDESFFGWGAEDDEFMDRLRTLTVGEGAFLPVLHLWHASAAVGDARLRNSALLDEALRTSPADRVARLNAQPFGGIAPLVRWERPFRTSASVSSDA